MTTNTDPVRALAELAERAVPFLRDEAAKYDDDGSNEPLELVREIETALASLSSDESALSSASSAFDGGREAAPCPHAREVDCDCANPPALASAPPSGDQCWCHTCRATLPITLRDVRMVLCPDCGNKRCPRANDHRNACTGSNEPGQPGSAYPAPPSAPVGVEQCAREAVALSLDERGFHQEAQNVREGEDLDEYRDELLIARIAAALAQQPAAPSGCPRGLGDSCCCSPAECGQPAAPSGEAVAPKRGEPMTGAQAIALLDKIGAAVDSTSRRVTGVQQPAAPSGEAVAWHIHHPDGFVSLRKRGAVDSHMREQAAADGVLIRPLVFGDAAPQQPAGVDEAAAQRLADAAKGDLGWSHLNPQARVEKARRYLALAAQQQGGRADG